MESQELIKEYGIKGAISHLESKLPSYRIPKILRNKIEYVKINDMIKEVKSLCEHENTKVECVDYHKRDFGTICKDCGKILNTNG